MAVGNAPVTKSTSVGLTAAVIANPGPARLVKVQTAGGCYVGTENVTSAGGANQGLTVVNTTQDFWVGDGAALYAVATATATVNTYTAGSA